MLEAINRFFKKHPKLSYASLILFLIVIEVGFSFCSKKKCGGFADDNFDNWLPYKEGQTLYFLSNKNDRDTFSGLSVTKSQPYETSGGYGGGGECNSDAVIKSNFNNSPDYLNISYSKYQASGSNNYLNFIIKNSGFIAFDLKDSGFVVNNYCSRPPIKATYYDTYNFNGTNYSKLQVIETDTTGSKTNAVYKVWLAKNVGIVGYESYPSLERWAKQ